MVRAVLDNSVTVTARSAVDSLTAEQLWSLYVEAFDPLQARAAARHVLTRDDFDLEVLDARVVKYVASDATGRIVGLGTLCNDLSTVPWISPAFYQRHYPRAFATRSLFYCGLIMVHPQSRGTGTFLHLATAIGRDIGAAGGSLAADMCQFNVDELQLAQTVTAVMRRTWGSAVRSDVDRQSYMVWEPDLSSAAGRVGTIPGARGGTD